MKSGRLHFVVVAAILLAVAAAAGAQVRIDVNISKPLFLGAGTSSGGGPVDLGTIDVTSAWVFFPEVQLYYQFGFDFLHAGVGARVFTFILQSIIYPAAYLELQLGPVVANLNVGGGWFGTFGLAGNGGEFGAVFFPDLNVGVNLTPWFRLGGGVFAAWAKAVPEGFLYAVYIDARFIFVLK
jgi:hypothetical protein